MATPKHETERVNLVAREFVRMYYKVMNAYPSYLFLFYEKDSTVVWSESQENNTTISVKASTPEDVQKLLTRSYEDESIRLLTCVPQNSIGGCILLLVSGRIRNKKHDDEERFFTQALVLGKQERGYYVKTDTVQVLSRTNSLKFNLLPFPHDKESRAENRRKPTENVQGTKHQRNDSCVDHHIDIQVPENAQSRPSSDTALVLKDHHPHHFKTAHTLTKNKPSGQTYTTITRPFGSGDEAAIIHNAEYLLKTATVDRSSHGRTHDNRSNDPRQHNSNEMQTSPQNVRPPELTSLFAARLPLDITPGDVNALFSTYGRLQKTTPVRVFTGLTNCYACVNFESESEMRKALAAEIVYDGSTVVTEIWRPRDRRGRRLGRDFGSRKDSAILHSGIPAGY